MNGHGMAHATVAKDLLAPLAPLPPILDHIERQDGTKLLDGQRVVASHSVERRDQQSSAVRNTYTTLLSNSSRWSSDECWIGKPLGCDQLSCDRLHLTLRQEVRTLTQELLPDLIHNWFVDNDGVLG